MATALGCTLGIVPHMLAPITGEFGCGGRWRFRSLAWVPSSCWRRDSANHSVFDTAGVCFRQDQLPGSDHSGDSRSKVPEKPNFFSTSDSPKFAQNICVGLHRIKSRCRKT